ncbi:MAG: hypothetical protein AAFX90_12525 [Pseudomonadota bacterium]
MKNNIINAPNGAGFFGYIEGVTTKRYTIPEAPIVLRHGFHKERHGKGTGFGAKHIWAGHSADLIRWGYPTLAHVSQYCEAILKHGVPVYPNQKTPGHSRLVAIRTYHGQVVVEYQAGQNVWSIVTAYKTRKPGGVQVTRIISAPGMP